MMNQIKIVIKYATLRKRMMNEPYNYTESEVAHTVWRILNVAPEIQAAFVAWFDKGMEPQLEYAGVSYADLRKHMHWNEFNTFLYMDLLRRDPNRGKYLLAENSEKLQTLTPDDLRTDLRERVKEGMARQKEENLKEGRVFDDRDEFVFEEGKPLVFKLNKNKSNQ